MLCRPHADLQSMNSVNVWASQVIEFGQNPKAGSFVLEHTMLQPQHIAGTAGGDQTFKGQPIICVTGYTGARREILQGLVATSGCEYTGSLSPRNTHLISASPTSLKTLAALKADEYDVHVVNHLWLMDSILSGKWQPGAKYNACGQTMMDAKEKWTLLDRGSLKHCIALTDCEEQTLYANPALVTTCDASRHHFDMHWRPEVQYEEANLTACSTGPCTSLKLNNHFKMRMHFKTNTTSDFEGVCRMDTASYTPSANAKCMRKKAMDLNGTPRMWAARGKDPTLLNSQNKTYRPLLGTCPHQTHTYSLGYRHQLLHVI
jgi:hypothetical protein